MKIELTPQEAADLIAALQGRENYFKNNDITLRPESIRDIFQAIEKIFQKNIEQ